MGYSVSSDDSCVVSESFGRVFVGGPVDWVVKVGDVIAVFQRMGIDQSLVPRSVELGHQKTLHIGIQVYLEVLRTHLRSPRFIAIQIEQCSVPWLRAGSKSQ